MKSKYLWLVMMGLLAMFTVVSCKSKPAPQEEAPAKTETPAPAPTVDKALLDALNKVIDRATAARKFVMDFEGPAFYPEDWKKADALYTEAGQQKKVSTNDEVKDSTARYTKAAEAFEAMTPKTLTAAYEYADREISAARNAAVAGRARELIPEFLDDADNVVSAAIKKYQAKDYYGAKDSAYEAYYLYEALTAGLAAYKVREEVVDRGFEKYDRSNVQKGDDSLRSAADDYVARDIRGRKKIDEASLRYNQALKTGWESYAGEKRTNATAERQKALDIKANVAVRQDYNPAQAAYNVANTAFQAKKFDEAARAYDECIAMFQRAARLALEKRRAAEENLRIANEKMAESDQKAQEAEVILEGGN